MESEKREHIRGMIDIEVDFEALCFVRVGFIARNEALVRGTE